MDELLGYFFERENSVELLLVVPKSIENNLSIINLRFLRKNDQTKNAGMGSKNSQILTRHIKRLSENPYPSFVTEPLFWQDVKFS